MEAHPHPTGQISIAVSDGRAVLRFSGELTAGTALLLEEKLSDPLLRESDEWIMDMTELVRMDLTCAFALRRALTRRPSTVSVRIVNARRAVERTLRHVGAHSTLAAVTPTRLPPAAASRGPSPSGDAAGPGGGTGLPV